MELKTNIIYYARSIDIYKQYQKTKDKQNFKKEHNGDIIKHEKAKTFFEKTNQKKLPKVKELQQQYQHLLEEKQQLCQQYTIAKKEMLEYQTTKQNIDKLLQTEQKKLEKDQEIYKMGNQFDIVFPLFLFVFLLLATPKAFCKFF